MLLFGVTLAGLVAAAHLAAPADAREMNIVTERPPSPASEYFLAHDRGGHVDHHVLYHGLDRTALERLRAADVLFLGNSRLMFALRSGTLADFFRDNGRTYYVMGFGHEEQDDFPERIIVEYDLRPSFVVINADGFFWDARSEWATRVAQESVFDAWKLQVEAEAAHAVRRRLHGVVPHYVDLYDDAREFIIYRSRLDGTWFVANDYGAGAAFRWPVDDRHVPSERSIGAAEHFKQTLGARGARMILCLVPAPDVSVHRARWLADHLGVPLVAPTVEGRLATIDGSHLSADSIDRFEAAFFAQLREAIPPRGR